MEGKNKIFFELKKNIIIVIPYLFLKFITYIIN